MSGTANGQRLNGRLETTAGGLDFALEAPGSNDGVARLEPLMRQGWYDGQVFHRMVSGLFVHGGCPNHNGTGSAIAPFSGPLPESGAYRRGTIALASTGPDKGNGSQFFICLRDVPDLPPDYPVIGVVTGGWDTLDAMNSWQTTANEELSPPIRMTSLRLA